MVVTPLTLASERADFPSPLLLPTQRRSRSRSPPSTLSTSAASSTFRLDSAPSSANGNRPPLRKNSTSSFSALSEFHLDLNGDDESTKEGGVEGVKHVDLSIDATTWRHPQFKVKVLSMLRKLKVPRWTNPALSPSAVHLQRVSGALTNAVFFVTFNPRPEPTSPSMSPMLTPTMPEQDPLNPPPVGSDQYPPTILLRIYGPSSGALISRDEELRILHVLSEVYGLGPRVYGTFLNGRVEQFFPSRALTSVELREPKVSRGIARRMRELHTVDLKMLGYPEGRDCVPTVWRCLEEWAALAEEVLTALEPLGGAWESWVEKFGLHRVQAEVAAYRSWIESHPGKGKGVVFAHNDTQYGNLLKLDAGLPPTAPDHHQYIVIDFEYAAPNPRGYDIANHFHEWRANYHHPTHSHSLQPHYPYPTPEQRENFYRAYLSISRDSDSGEEVLGKRSDVSNERVSALGKEVEIWSPTCSIFWALWGVVQAEEQIAAILEGKPDFVPEFDYLAYAMERMDMFRDEARSIGVPLPTAKGT